LNRLARNHGFSDAHALCAALSHSTGEPIRVIDLILWRYAASYQADCCKVSSPSSQV
jgi:hypothetical protein